MVEVLVEIGYLSKSYYCVLCYFYVFNISHASVEHCVYNCRSPHPLTEVLMVVITTVETLNVVMMGRLERGTIL